MLPSLQPGQYLAGRSQSHSNIVSTDHVWVQGEPKETELTYVKPEQKVQRSTSIAIRGERWAGNGRQHKPGIGLELLVASGRRIPAGNWVKVRPGVFPMRAGHWSTMRPASHRCASAMSVEVNVDHRSCPRISQFHSRSLWIRKLKHGLMLLQIIRGRSTGPRLRVWRHPSPLSCRRLDTTIANVALPYMQGSVVGGMARIRSTGVLTSYIVGRGDHDPAIGVFLQPGSAASAS